MDAVEARPIQDWVAIEQVAATMAGDLYLPTYKAPQLFVGRVLAIGRDAGMLQSGARVELPFEPGDFVLCTYQTGHPYMAGERPSTVEGRPGRTVPVDLDCDVFGGSNGKAAGLVPFMPQGLPPIHTDDEAARRVERVQEIKELEHIRKNHLDAEPDPRRIEELVLHAIALTRIERRRAGKRRTRFVLPVWDEAKGEGIVAVVEDLSTLLALGLDPVDLYAALHPNDHEEDDDAPDHSEEGEDPTEGTAPREAAQDPEGP